MQEVGEQCFPVDGTNASPLMWGEIAFPLQIQVLGRKDWDSWGELCSLSSLPSHNAVDFFAGHLCAAHTCDASLREELLDVVRKVKGSFSTFIHLLAPS